MNNQQWFIDRIQKIVYRDPNGCECLVCKRVGSHGLKISDRNHAIYLFDIQASYAAEGIELNYRDELKK